MAYTAQSQVLKLLTRVDPYLKVGTLVTSATIAAWDSAGGGDKFTAQYVADIYNDARYALYQSMTASLTKQQMTKYVPGLITSVVQIMASGSGTKPTGYLTDVSFKAVDGITITVAPMGVKDYVDNLEGNSLYIVYETGTSFVAPSSTYLPDGNASLWYFKLVDITLATIVDGTANETYDQMWAPVLVELAVAIANGLGRAQVLDLASKLIKGSLQ